MKVNLGAADRHIEGYTCLDIAPFTCQQCSFEGLFPWVWDLNNQFPFPDNSVLAIKALDVCEHIGDVATAASRFGVRAVLNPSMLAVVGPNAATGLYTWKPSKYGRVHFMNECHRILVPGGILEIETPDAAHGPGYFQDPTHVSPYTRNSFQYYGAGPGGDFARGRLGDAYGITARFNMIQMGSWDAPDAYELVVKLGVTLEAVK